MTSPLQYDCNSCGVDIYDDLISRRVNSSDAEKFAEVCPCPCNGFGWGIIWWVLLYIWEHTWMQRRLFYFGQKVAGLWDWNLKSGIFLLQIIFYWGAQTEFMSFLHID